MRVPIRAARGGFLPQDFDVAHDLCFVIHDILAQLLKSGEESGIFESRFVFRHQQDRAAFEHANDVLEWLATTRRREERAEFLVKTIFPAILSDMLHFIYEALESSRKAKLNVTYALIRKPLQENLFLLETALAERIHFVDQLGSDPIKLRAQKAGGLQAHTDRIQRVLDLTKQAHFFSAPYLAQLRYQKSDDGFDGICNLAIHLFTEHPVIRTEPLNINFIFSGWDEKISQWLYLYSRLPYVLAYTYRVVEQVCHTFCATDPSYLADMDRRIAALVLGWWKTVPNEYRTAPLGIFVRESKQWLDQHCRASGYHAPTVADLDRMGRSGAYPGESWFSVKRREFRHGRAAAANRRKVEE